MSNFSIKEDLLKIQGAFITNIKGKTTTKKCLVIPIEGSGMFLGEKGCYLNLTATETQNSQYGDSHFLKVNVDKDTYNKMTDEEKKAIPIIGNMKPMEARQAPQMEVKETQVAENEDDLPF